MRICGNRVATLRALALRLALVPLVMDELRRDNTRRHSQYRVAQQHDNGRQEAARSRNRGNVAIAHGGHRHHGPVDTGRDIGEGGALHLSLYHIHKRAERYDHDDYKEEKDHNLTAAEPKGAHQHVALLEEAEQFEDAENPNQAEGSHHHQVTHRPEYPSQIERQRAYQVNDAIETEDVGPGFGRTVDAANVFQRKEESESVLAHGKDGLHDGRKARQALHHNEQDAQHYGPQQDDIEQLAQRRITLEDDGVETTLQALITHQGSPHILQFRHTS